MDQLRGRSDNEANDFTDAHLLVAAALAPAVVPILTKASPNATLSQIGTTTRELANALGTRLKSAGGGSITPGDAAIVHDFVTLHCVRGIDAHRAAFPGTACGKPSANPPADPAAGLGWSRSRESSGLPEEEPIVGEQPPHRRKREFATTDRGALVCRQGETWESSRKDPACRVVARRRSGTNDHSVV
jgi:hypothetical protein